jgi:phosphate/sulfate permease
MAAARFRRQSIAAIGQRSKSVVEYIGEHTVRQDLKRQSMMENRGSAAIWNRMEQYDAGAEKMFACLQVFTAGLNAFSHGANFANAIAPVSTIITIYATGAVPTSGGVQMWILAYGGVALVLGLFFFGYRIIKSVGYKLAALSPSRGACAQLSASLIVATAAYLGLPVSSTQCVVGAVTGVGLVTGAENVQWRFLARVCLGWVVIFLTSVILSAGLFSFVAYSPSLVPP